MKKKKNNSEKIIANHISGILHSIKLEVVINGKIINHFKSFYLHQSVRTHHFFELELAHDVLESIQNHTLEDVYEFLGKRITIVFKYKNVKKESPENTFVGVITEVIFDQKHGSLGNIILKGASPTILMDSSPHTQSFGGCHVVNTGIIANQIFNQTLDSSMFDIRIDTQYKGGINYSSQYNETHYNYLVRLAENYGEQFYYDGETLHFGKLPSSQGSIDLIYGSNVNDIKVELKAIHIKPEFFAYNSVHHLKINSILSKIKHFGDLSMKAYELNVNIYKNRSLIPTPINANMFLDIDDVQKSAAGSAAVEVFVVSGTCTIPFLYIGCIVDLEMRKPSTNQTSYFTKLMITEVVHDVNENGLYKGRFSAISEGTGYMPKPNFKRPSIGPQIATVISNTDPLNQGRIQVQFDWQVSNNTHFIRMMSPDAGGTDIVPKNRGFVTIPEVGDQVMVGFEYANPDFPFVMGGMFHGKVGVGGGVDNHIKSIQTRSGNKIIFNDKEGSVLIGDSSGSTYLMDGKGNIEVAAPQNMNFTAGGNMQINVNSSLAFNVGITATITAPELQQLIASKLYTQAAQTVLISQDKIKIEAKETIVTGIKKLFIHSDENATVNSLGTIEINGKKGNNQTNTPKESESKSETKEKCNVQFNMTAKGSLTTTVNADGTTTSTLTTNVTVGPVTLDLTVSTTVEPKALKLDYDKTIFKLDKESLTTSVGVSFVPITLTTTNTFEQQQEIKAVAIYENSKGEEEEEVVGKLNIFPRSK